MEACSLNSIIAVIELQYIFVQCKVEMSIQLKKYVYKFFLIKEKESYGQ